MAGEWIKVESATADKPEIKKLARLLGVDRDAAFGKVIRLWCWFDINSVDGAVDGVVSTDVDDLVRCEGFAVALRTVGWLEFDDEAERVTLPKFGDHNGETAKARAGKARRQAKWRAGAGADDVDGGASTAGSTREEKRRSSTPKPPEGVPPKAKAKGDGKPMVELKTYLAALAEDQPAIPGNHAVFRYAEAIGLPNDFLGLAWKVFKRDMLASGKRQKDWPATFDKYVRKGYLKLWFADTSGYSLTSTGVSERRFFSTETQA